MFGVAELVKLFDCMGLMFSAGDSSQAAGDTTTSREHSRARLTLAIKGAYLAARVLLSHTKS